MAGTVPVFRRFIPHFSLRKSRIFVPTPHGNPSWHRGNHRRTALERIPPG
ncbi:hypothetical protein ACCUM_1020 [Candidatus Accumulibacter phosphatis]|uniref:Uncharacterized protein n=1 Tax=Candidatus Accumulibacter phosphatis TaxID=327160 RepID=A0A5S4EGQ7_9PROT|nr:hypothetical protein ACCUM_1020 [Candidatus Accumulibacter phosphatis]